MLWGRLEMSGMLRRSMEHLACTRHSRQAPLHQCPTKDVFVVTHLCFDLVESLWFDGEVQLPDLRLQQDNGNNDQDVSNELMVQCYEYPIWQYFKRWSAALAGDAEAGYEGMQQQIHRPTLSYLPCTPLILYASPCSPYDCTWVMTPPCA